MTISAISFPNLISGDAGLSGSVAGGFSSVSIFKSALHILALCLSGHVVEIVSSQLEDRKHKASKSLLLTRVATALNLEFRHYNASLLNFDDLVGFPLPGKDGRLEYVKTPASVWGAGAVIFDEISRCRPDIQNKLFPIIHERRVQGIALECNATDLVAVANSATLSIGAGQ